MSLTVQTNLAALEAHRQLGISNDAMTKSLERLSSGYRVNKAADDAAGLSMSNKFVAQIASMNVASRNVSQTNSLLQIAEGGTDQISQILVRLKELATQAASANTASTNLPDINTEATALKNEIDRIAGSTTFQGSTLIDGNFGTGTGGSCTMTLVAYEYGFSSALAANGTYSVAASNSAAHSTAITIKNLDTNITQTITIQTVAATYNFSALGISFSVAQGASVNGVVTVFASAFVTAADSGIISSGTGAGGNTFQIGESNSGNYQIQFSIGGATAAILSVSAISLASQAGAQSAMDKIDNAITTLNSTKASLGAAMNRLGYASANLNVAVENASAANSVIKDVDMAQEMTNFTKNQILVQAGTAMLAQANMSSQTILSLFK